MISKGRDCRGSKCTTVLHGGICHRTVTPHKSGNKIVMSCMQWLSATHTYPSFISAMSSTLGLSPKCVQLITRWFGNKMKGEQQTAHMNNRSVSITELCRTGADIP